MHGSLKMQPEWAYMVIKANNTPKDRKLKPKYPFVTQYPQKKLRH